MLIFARPRYLLGLLGKSTGPLVASSSQCKLAQPFNFKLDYGSRDNIRAPLTRAFQYSAQHVALRDTCKKIVDKEINPFVDRWEEEENCPVHDIFKILGKAGLLGITHDPLYGGLGLDFSYAMAFFEEVSRIHSGAFIAALGVQTHMAIPALANYGSDSLKREFLVPSIQGDFAASLAISEPGGGSDVAALKTSAATKANDLIINGCKTWITNALNCDWLCVLANTSHGPPHRNKSLICVPRNSPGLKISKPIKTMGHKAIGLASIYFDDVRVPKGNIIGDEGMGFIYQMMHFVDERLYASAVTCHQIQHLLDETIRFCNERQTFGKPLIQNQVIQFRLAELKSENELLRSLNNRIADMIIRGERDDHDCTLDMLASIAKLKSGRLARESADACLQYFGGNGYATGSYVERFYRDCRSISIAGGADEIMLGIVIKLMNMIDRKPKT